MNDSEPMFIIEDGLTFDPLSLPHWDTFLREGVTEEHIKSLDAKYAKPTKRKRKHSEVLKLMNTSSILVKRSDAKVKTDEWAHRLSMGRAGELYVAKQLLALGFDVKMEDGEVNWDERHKFHDQVDLWLKWERGAWVGLQVKTEPKATYTERADLKRYSRGIWVGRVCKWQASIERGCVAMVKVSGSAGLVGLTTRRITDWEVDTDQDYGDEAYRPSWFWFCEWDALVGYLKAQSRSKANA